MKLKSWLKELPYTLLQGSLETRLTRFRSTIRESAAPGRCLCCMRGQTSIRIPLSRMWLKRARRFCGRRSELRAPENVTVIQVENGRNALSLLSAARFDYPARKMTAIGVTGTKRKDDYHLYESRRFWTAAGQKTGLIGTNGAVIVRNHYPTKNTTPESYFCKNILQKWWKRAALRRDGGFFPKLPVCTGRRTFLDYWNFPEYFQ